MMTPKRIQMVLLIFGLALVGFGAWHHFGIVLIGGVVITLLAVSLVDKA